MHKVTHTDTHIHRTLLFLQLSSLHPHNFSFLQFSRFPPKNNLLFPAYPVPFSTSNSSIIIVSCLSLNLHGHAHRRPTSCRLSIIPLSQKGIEKRDISLFVVPPVRKSIRDGAKATAQDGCRPQKTN